MSFVFGHTDYKTIGVGRTDAKVSALNFPVQIFIDKKIDSEVFMDSFNKNASGDLKALIIEECKTSFAVINAPKIKTYHYYFSFGEKMHPFAAPFMTGIIEDLDLEKMQEAAQIFEGKHHFNKYCCKPTENTIFVRTLDSCKIIKNEVLTANFFPENSYILEVKGLGFLRYQIRYMMAVLLEVGRHNMSLEDVKHSISEENDGSSWHFVAPSSGLQLYAVDFIV